MLKKLWMKWNLIGFSSFLFAGGKLTPEFFETWEYFDRLHSRRCDTASKFDVHGRCGTFPILSWGLSRGWASRLKIQQCVEVCKYVSVYRNYQSWADWIMKHRRDQRLGTNGDQNVKGRRRGSSLEIRDLWSRKNKSRKHEQIRPRLKIRDLRLATKPFEKHEETYSRRQDERPGAGNRKDRVARRQPLAPQDKRAKARIEKTRRH